MKINLHMFFNLKSIVKIVILVLVASFTVNATVRYVSTTGDDLNNPGTIDQPYQTITKAISVSVAGDTIYVRGGIYSLTATISIGSSKSGTSINKYYLLAYPEDIIRPVLDFSGIAFGFKGIYLRASYWFIKGFDIKGAGDNGMNITGSNNIIEYCALYENQDSGLQLGGGASNNQIINCDSYFNMDPGQGNADGFAPKLDVGTGNYFYGCRSWQNSDDGWDGYVRPRPANKITTTLENCWCFNNGYLKSGIASIGNGNGFKMGGSDSANLSHNFILKKCLAFDNRVKGFDQNNNRGSMTILNCTGYRNQSKNFSITGALTVGETLTVKNCIAFPTYGSLGSFAVQQTNSWLSPFTTPSLSDFISLDTAGVRGPRKPDGSLPDINFLQLASGSQFINSGSDVGLPFNGSAPDLGAFETTEPGGVKYIENIPMEFKLYQNYPNPFNPETKINFSLANSGYASLIVYNILGEEVETLFARYAEAGRMYIVDFNAVSLGSGLYFYKLFSNGHTQMKKLMLLK
jgi:hypothetical protein